MFGDDYVRKIGHATEVEAKAALFHILYRMYAKDKGLGEDALDDDTAKLAAAVTNKVFGERGTEEAYPAFAFEKATVIESRAKSLSSNDELCVCLSGAAYNTCYARYVEAGGSRGMFSNKFLTYVRALSRYWGATSLSASVADVGKLSFKLAQEIQGELGENIIAPLKSMESLNIFRPLPHNPNERRFYEAIHQFAMKAGVKFKE